MEHAHVPFNAHPAMDCPSISELPPYPWRALTALFRHQTKGWLKGEPAEFGKNRTVSTADGRQANGREGLWHTFHNVLHSGLSDLQVEVLDQVAENDKVTTRKRITGCHSGPLIGMPATGRAVSIDVIDIVRIGNGQYVEHWGINSLSSVLATLRSG